MIRNVAEFYLWGMVLSFVITLWVGASGADYGKVFMLATLSWPLALLLMLAKSRAHLIRATPNQV